MLKKVSKHAYVKWTVLTKNERADNLIILLVLILGMWPVVFMKYTLKWDAESLYLPWKHFITESLVNGHIPLWTPFINAGFPQMGDPGTWYPVSWLLGFIRKYDFYSLNIEFLIHLFIAGAGVLKFCRFSRFTRNTSLIMAISYMFSGFFISNAQHIGWLVGAAWIPWIFYFLLRLLTIPTLETSVLFALVCFFSLSGGYPGVFIITAYLVLLVVIYQLLKSLFLKEYARLKKSLWFLTTALVVFMVLSGVVLSASFDISHYISRNNGLEYHNNSWGIQNGSLYPVDMLTFIIPFGASVNDKSFWIEDFSLINLYIGILPLILIFTGLLANSKNKKTGIFVLIALVFLATGMATIFPFRRWLYTLVPFMDLFRFPTLFRIFTIAFLLLAMGYALEVLIKDKNFKEKLLKGLIVTLCFILLFIIAALFKVRFKFSGNFNPAGMFTFLKSTGVWERILIQLLIQFFLISGLLFLIRKKTGNYGSLLLLFVVFDMILAVRLNSPATITGAQSPKKFISFRNLPDDYPIPDLSNPMLYTGDDFYRKNNRLFYTNNGSFLKIPSYDGNSPYSLKTTKNAIKNNCFDESMQYPLLFFTSGNDERGRIDSMEVDRDSEDKIRIISFDPNRILMKTKAEKPGTLCFLQNYYKDWKAFVDGRESAITLMNCTFMGIVLPEGEHTVEFRFAPGKIRFLFYVSFIFLLIILVYLLMDTIRHLQSESNKTSRNILVLTVMIILFLILGNKVSRNTNAELYNKLQTELQKAKAENPSSSFLTILNIDNPDNPAITSRKDSFCQIRLSGYEDLPGFITLLDTISADKLFYAHINAAHIPEIEFMLGDKYPAVISKKEYGNARFYLFGSESNIKESGNTVNYLNDFEKNYPYWTDIPNILDSIVKWDGKYSIKLDSNHIYSPAFRCKFKEVTDKKNTRIIIKLKTKFDPDAHPLLVYEVIRNEKRIIWEVQDMAFFYNQNTFWQTVYYLQNENSFLKPGDEIQIYVWNNTKKEVFIDNFQVQFIISKK